MVLVVLVTLLAFELDPVEILNARVNVRDWAWATMKYHRNEKSPRIVSMSKFVNLIFFSHNNFFIGGIKRMGTVMARPMKAVL